MENLRNALIFSILISMTFAAVKDRELLGREIVNSVPTAYDLRGEWQVENVVWKCSYVSKTEVNCIKGSKWSQNKVTINGEIVTWENNGATGTISQSGINYDTINWGKGLWKKLDNSCTDIKVVTDVWGKENSWTFGACSSAQKYQEFTTTNEQCCQPAGNYELVCKDSSGDGWHGGYLEINGQEYCKEFNTGNEKKEDATMANDCTSSEFTCDSGRCIPQSYVHDGDNDCGDGGDERADCKTINVNTVCVSSATTLIVNDIGSYDCPAQVDKSNWLSTDKYGDTFAITMNSVTTVTNSGTNTVTNSVTVTRTDDGGSGWCMPLSFKCCKVCVKWRQTGECRSDGPREVLNDKSCYDEIDTESGYCECGNGDKKMKKGCYSPSHYGFGYKTCEDACTGHD